MQLMTQDTAAVVLPSVDSSVRRLARFFPSTTPVRFPVRVTGKGTRVEDLREQTRIEFGSADTVLFGCELPLELNDLVFLRSPDKSFEAEAIVVAMLYCNGGRAVAARFTSEVPNWIIKP